MIYVRELESVAEAHAIGEEKGEGCMWAIHTYSNASILSILLTEQEPTVLERDRLEVRSDGWVSARALSNKPLPSRSHGVFQIAFACTHRARDSRMVAKVTLLRTCRLPPRLWMVVETA